MYQSQKPKKEWLMTQYRQFKITSSRRSLTLCSMTFKYSWKNETRIRYRTKDVTVFLVVWLVVGEYWVVRIVFFFGRVWVGVGVVVGRVL